MQIVSDLHLEIPMTMKSCAAMREFQKSDGASVLALVGDICTVRYRSRYEEFLRTFAPQYELVLVLTGNHEYYSCTRARAEEVVAEICAPLENVHFLNCSAVEFQGA